MILNANFPPHVQTWITRQVEEGRYPSVEAAITDAVERAMDAEYRWEEDKKLLASIAEADRGDVTPGSDDLLDRLSEEAWEQSRHGHQAP